MVNFCCLLHYVDVAGFLRSLQDSTVSMDEVNAGDHMEIEDPSLDDNVE